MTAGSIAYPGAVRRLPFEATLEGVFRIGIASCFIGHGAFGVLTKDAWLPYFGLVGITPDNAYGLMPLVGLLDILVGIVGLLSPRRAVFVYMTFWAVWTALLRPLTGESGWEFVERAGNYGVPLAFLLAVGVGTPRTWFERVRITSIASINVRLVAAVLRATTVLLLFGHGALAVTGANGLVSQHLAAVGLSSDLAPVLGGFEIGIAIALAFRASPALLISVAVWKLATETLFPLAGASWWEVVERGGSYTAPILLALLMTRNQAPRRDADHSTSRLHPEVTT